MNVGTREWREEHRDMADTESREAFREPGLGEEACDCDEGLRHWQQGTSEGTELCPDCGGSGCVPAPICSQATADYFNALTRKNVHPIFEQVLAPYAPKDEAA